MTTALETEDTLKLGKYTFRNRLFVGTGKYETLPLMKEALLACEAEVVTVAVRRVDLNDNSGESLMDYIPKGCTLLPNTAGCFNAEDAIRYCKLARSAGVGDFVKLEVLADKQTLLPDPVETLKATEILVKDGFTVLVYTSDDPVLALKLEEAGATAVMPAGAPIGSGQGILNPNNIRIILERANVPIIVDAGVGTASDVSFAMELGADGVLLNTGIAGAKNPVAMAKAMHHACQAGYLAKRAGRIPKKLYSTASSPTTGLMD
jgi:thiazole synthase